MNDAALSIEDSEDRFRMVIPLRWQEKVLLFVATTVILGFGLFASFFACAMIAQTELRKFWWVPLLLSGVIVLLYLFCALYIWFIPPTVLEFNGDTLHVGTVGSQWQRSWQSRQIKSISVLRLPMVPIGTVVIQPRVDLQVRVGFWKSRELLAAVNRLSDRMGLA